MRAFSSPSRRENSLVTGSQTPKSPPMMCPELETKASSSILSFIWRTCCLSSSNSTLTLLRIFAEALVLWTCSFSRLFTHPSDPSAEHSYLEGNIGSINSSGPQHNSIVCDRSFQVSRFLPVFSSHLNVTLYPFTERTFSLHFVSGPALSVPSLNRFRLFVSRVVLSNQNFLDSFHFDLTETIKPIS